MRLVLLKVAEMGQKEKNDKYGAETNQGYNEDNIYFVME